MLNCTESNCRLVKVLRKPERKYSALLKKTRLAYYLHWSIRILTLSCWNVSAYPDSLDFPSFFILIHTQISRTKYKKVNGLYSS